MGDHDGGSAVPWRSSPFPIVSVIAVITMAAWLGGRPVVPAGSGPAVVTVGLVLAEAITLYVGYGALTRIAGRIARDLLEGN
uniref:DUF7512 family protein n=1 Tax=Halalkalicoccus ordinarius TaxID=3116651 RepID=UPI00300E965D